MASTWRRHRLLRARRITWAGSLCAKRRDLGEGEPGRHVPVERVVGGGLVGDEVGGDAAPHQLRVDVGGVPEQPHRERPALAPGRVEPAERVVERAGRLVEVAGGEPLLRSAPGPRRRPRKAAPEHGGGERLGAAHPAEPPGEDEPAGEVVRAEVGPPGLREGLVGALQDSLRADVDPGPRRHLAVHHEAALLELPEVLPGGPVRRPGWSWR